MLSAKTNSWICRKGSRWKCTYAKRRQPSSWIDSLQRGTTMKYHTFHAFRINMLRMVFIDPMTRGLIALRWPLTLRRRDHACKRLPLLWVIRTPNKCGLQLWLREEYSRVRQRLTPPKTIGTLFNKCNSFSNTTNMSKNSATARLPNKNLSKS